MNLATILTYSCLGCVLLFTSVLVLFRRKYVTIYYKRRTLILVVASGALRCKFNNGGCWKDSQQGRTYTACIDDHTKGCKCPAGFRGDVYKNFEDIDECEEKTACQCSECKCKNTWGSYDCSCGGDLLYIREHDTCISKDAISGVAWGFVSVVILGLAVAGAAGYAFYKYRIRTYMDSEIRAIMAQYMPLDNQAEVAVHASHGNV